MTEQEFDSLLCRHERWLDAGAHICDDRNKMRIEYEVVTGTLDHRDFEYAFAVRCIFRNVIFKHCNFKDWRAAECSFFGCTFRNCTFDNADFEYSMFYSCDFNMCTLYNSSFGYSMITFSNLRESTLSLCDFKYSSIMRSDLRTAKFVRDVKFEGAGIQNSYFPEEYERILGKVLAEPIIGYKKTREGVVIKAEIPAGAIVFSINGKKCRTNRAKIIDMNGHTVLHSAYDFHFSYTLGQEIEILDFDPCYSHECAPGFHFFMTEEEAKAYAV